MMFSLNTSSSHSLVHLEHVDDGSPGGSWVTETLAPGSMSFQFQFDVTDSGQPKLITLDSTSGYTHYTTTSWTSLHQEIRTFNDFGTFPASSIDANGDLHMVYSHPTIEKLYYSYETVSGWSSSEILSNANLSSSPSLWFDHCLLYTSDAADE